MTRKELTDAAIDCLGNAFNRVYSAQPDVLRAAVSIVLAADESRPGPLTASEVGERLREKTDA